MMMMMIRQRSSLLGLLLLVLLLGGSGIITLAFCPSSRRRASGHAPMTRTTPASPSPLVGVSSNQQHYRRCPRTTSSTTTTSTTSLSVLLDVPDGFFTVTFPMLGILLQISKTFGRIRMEENAWEQRLAEARRMKLRANPTLTELEVRQQEAALEWSAYGKPRFEEQAAMRRESSSSSNGRRRTKVMDRDDDDDDDDDDYDDAYARRRSSTSTTTTTMTDEEIRAFELEYGVDYDPYYDEPYREEELPTVDKDGNPLRYTTDRRYGDRIYENGEVFYRDTTNNNGNGEKLYYRQGAKPRNLKFWQ